MGLIADAMSISKSGLAKTSVALDLLRASQSEEQCKTQNLLVVSFRISKSLASDVVWGEIASQLSELISVWWEQPLAIREGLDTFRRVGFVYVYLSFFADWFYY